MRNITFFSILILLAEIGFGQITTTPELPTAYQSITITFDSSKEGRLGYYTGELYAHTGVLLEGKNDWQYVIESWGNNSTQPKLTNKGNGIYELEITPDAYSFYLVPSNEKIVQIALVFRSADASKQTNDLFINIYEEGLVVDITSPMGSSILQKNVNYSISARTSVNAELTLSVDETELIQNIGQEITTEYSFTESGNYWIIAKATADNETVYDSTKIFVRDDVVIETKPNQYRKGINYPSENSAALVLWAPLKEHVFVIGDFNNWEYSNDFLMKKDGDFFWLEINNLEKGVEYAFQYVIDGEIIIADPYTEKILDPWNDDEITPEIYPGLKAYPDGKTEGIVSVLQPGQNSYLWEIENFQIPEKEKLIIYELLIRDFTSEKTYESVREKLDYLEDLNINVLELMPVNEFEGNDSWGYNPSFYFAPDKYYGPKNELKKLIDECHKRGIAVVIDMVLNHSYGQSPFVQMYMDNWTIKEDNPWYNISSPNQVFQWGFDFNHEAEAVQELVDSVNSFWLNEYKVDGFRFDFTKGFTQTPGDGWQYDASRIEILKRMADEIWERKPGTLIILEHLSENPEETELANHGMLLWGNMHGSYLQAARGNTENSDLSWAVFTERGWDAANLVSYPESHDEERIMYEIKRTGLSSGDYNIKNQQTALDRIELNSLFHLLLPGPKMIWQFGERGYDLSINRCINGTIGECRLDPKPPYWHYLNNQNRVDVFRVMAKLNFLKKNQEVFSKGTFSFKLTGEIKSYMYQSNENKVIALGNFGLEENNSNIAFPETGKYYEFFSGDSITIADTQAAITLSPGEYRLYSKIKMEKVRVATRLKENKAENKEITIYPNPAKTSINLEFSLTKKEHVTIQLINLNGKIRQTLVDQDFTPGKHNQIYSLKNFNSGIYILMFRTKNSITTNKLIIQGNR